MNEPDVIRTHERVTNEKDGEVQPDQVVVAYASINDVGLATDDGSIFTVLSIKLRCKSTRVPGTVWEFTLTLMSLVLVKD
jgi:hypothetical protein